MPKGRSKKNLSKPYPKSLPYEAGFTDIQLNYIVSNYIPDDKTINVCDYGCGNAPFLAALSKNPKKRIWYLPVDIDDEMLTNAGNGMLDNPQLEGPLDSSKPSGLSKYRGQFDLVIMHHLLHELRPEEVFEGAFSLLKRGGRLIIGDFTRFWWYEHDHVFFDSDAIKTLFGSANFDVKSIPHSYKGKYKHFLAEVSLKEGARFYKLEFISRLKDAYSKKLQDCRDQINKYDSPYKGVPEEVKVARLQETHLMRRLEELEEAPEFKLIKDVEALIEGLSAKHEDWEKGYIPQRGRTGKTKAFSPNEFLQLSQLERLSKKLSPGEDREKPERAEREFEKTETGHLLEIINKPGNEKLVLLGDPGLGKTTALRYLAHYFARHFDTFQTIPVYIELKYSNSLSREINLSGNKPSEVLKHFGICLMLDGYNEVGKGKLTKVDTQINGLLRKHDNLRVLISSRKITYPEFSDFNTCEIEPLDERRIKAYLVKAIGKGRHEKVFEDIRGNGLLELASIPLFLRFMCELVERKEAIPDTKGKLLEKIIEIKFMGRPEERLKEKYRVRRGLIMDLLAGFCYERARDAGGIAFKEKDLFSFIWKWIKENHHAYRTEDILHEIKEHGLVEDHLKELSFWHQQFFDYFAARHLKEVLEGIQDERERLKAFVSYFRYKRWDEILEIALGLMDIDLMKYFKAGPVRAAPWRISLLIDLSVMKKDPAICIELLKDKKADVRSSATRALGEIKSPEAVQPLLRLLKAEDAVVRSSAAEALGGIKSPEAVQLLLGRLKDKDWDVRSSAAEALGDIKAPEAVQPLIGLLKDKDEDAGVRASAAQALGEIKSPEAVQPLLRLLKDKDWGVRYAAADALGKIKSPDAVRPLLGLLKNNDWGVRFAAAEALGAIKSPDAVKPLLGLLKNDRNVRNVAKYALAEIIDSVSEEEKINLLEKAVEAGMDDLESYRLLKTIRWIPEKLLKY